jgi:phosphoribosylamine-glycine ligase
MKILVIGSGGREHALVWKLSQSKLATKIFCAPGNAGIAGLAALILKPRMSWLWGNSAIKKKSILLLSARRSRYARALLMSFLNAD